MTTTMMIVMAAAFVGASALIFGLLTLVGGQRDSGLESRLDVLTGAAAPERGGKKNEPSLLQTPLDDVPGMLERIMARFPNLSKFLKQSGLKVKPGRFIALSVGLGVAGSALPYVAGAHVAIGPMVGLTAGILPFMGVFVIRKRRLAAFAKLLPEALELISRALRAGHSLAAGINLVAHEMKAPVSEEFLRCYEEQNFGIPLEEALLDMAERVPNMDLRFFVTAVILQRQTGGDLAEILDKIGRLIRERFKLFGAIQALTGEGRLSGVILLALPPVLFGTIYRLNPEYVSTLFTDPLGKQMLLVAVVFQLLGAVVIRKIVNIKV